MVTGVVSVGRALVTAIVFTPVPVMLKLIVSLVPNVPGFWLVMSGSPRSLPALTAVIASRSDTLPSFGVRSSAVVVIVTTAGTDRSSSRSTRGRAPRPVEFRRMVSLRGERPAGWAGGSP